MAPIPGLITLLIMIAVILVVVNRRKQTPVFGAPTNEQVAVRDRVAQRDQFTMTISDVFPISGKGIGVVGEVAAGTVSSGDRVRILTKTGSTIAISIVTSLYTNYKPAAQATVGDQCGLHLADLSAELVARGDQVVAAQRKREPADSGSVN